MAAPEQGSEQARWHGFPGPPPALPGTPRCRYEPDADTGPHPGERTSPPAGTTGPACPLEGHGLSRRTQKEHWCHTACPKLPLVTVY